MRVLDCNQKYLLLTGNKKTLLYELPGLVRAGELEGEFSQGSLQYRTGIAALAKDSIVRFHDFKYDRKIEQLDTILPILHLKIIKNLLFCSSAQRILIYDLCTRKDLGHMPIYNGSLVALTSDYNSLKILYANSPTNYDEQQLWTNRTSIFEYSEAHQVKYDSQGRVVCLVGGQGFALYEGGEILSLCQIGTRIVDVVAARKPGTFYLQLHPEGGGFEYMQIAANNKFYMKLQQTDQTAEANLGNQICFELNGQLIIWKQDRIYRAVPDCQPHQQPISGCETKQLVGQSGPAGQQEDPPTV